MGFGASALWIRGLLLQSVTSPAPKAFVTSSRTLKPEPFKLAEETSLRVYGGTGMSFRCLVSGCIQVTGGAAPFFFTV